MSLHRYLVSPPLAINITPAKPHPPPRTEKKSDPQDKDKDKDKGKQEEKKVEGPAPDPKADGNKAEPDPAAEPKANADVNGVIKVDGAADPKAEAGGGVEPNTPGSMVPEPPTPATGVVVDANAQTTAPNDPNAEAKDDSKGKPKATDPTAKDKKAVQADETKADNKEPFIGPLPKPDSEPEPELIPEPLRLIGPPPKYPIRARLDLNPSKPWPPIESDPRGAYHHYAKGCYRGIIESVYIDVTKDGWMTEHWKEKSERDALAKLRGGDVRKARRELEWAAKLSERKKVPKSAGEVLLALWNLLVEAPNNEVCRPSLPIILALSLIFSYLPRRSGRLSTGMIQLRMSMPSRFPSRR
jgi:hypothetical protein